MTATQPACRPDARGDVAGQRAHHAEQDPDRREAQERIENAERCAKLRERAGQHVEAAAGVHLVGRDARRGR